jgi:hypothetical protein
MICKTMPLTAIGVEPGIGGEASVAIDDDKLVTKDNINSSLQFNRVVNLTIYT